MTRQLRIPPSFLLGRAALILFALGILATAPAVAAQASAAADPNERLLLIEHDTAGRETIVEESAGRFVVTRRHAGSAAWAHELPARPNFLQAGTPAGTVAVGHLRNDGSPRWALVVSEDGERWSPPGDVRLIHLSPLGDKVLVQTLVDGGEQTLVFGPRGRRLVHLDLPHGAAHVVRFSARGDAVAVTPGPEEDSSSLSSYEIGSGRSWHHQLDPAFPIEDAVALDAHHVVVVGGGVLTMVLFPEAGELADQGVFAWTLRTDGPGYLTLRGATADGERFLVSRGFGRFDLIGRDGGLLWSFDSRDRSLRQRLTEIDLDRVQAFLRPDGAVELLDDTGRGRYLLTWTQAGAAELGPLRLAWKGATSGG